MVYLKTNWDHSIIFEIASKYCLLGSFVDYEGYSISSKEFLPAVVDIKIIWIKFAHFSSLIPKMSMFSLHLLLDHAQFTLIHRPNIPGSYALLFFTALDFTFPTRHIHFGPAASFFLELLVIGICSSPVAYWTPSNLGGSSFSAMCFAFSYCSWGSYGKNTGVGCHFLLRQTIFCQNSSLWPICLGWPCMVWLIASLSYTSPFAMARPWSVKRITL